MQKKYWIMPVIVTVTLVVSLFALSTPNTTISQQKPTCCKKIGGECPSKMKKLAPEQSSLENLSNQFISLPLYY